MTRRSASSVRLALVLGVVAAGTPSPPRAQSARASVRAVCPALARPDRDGRFVAREDLAPALPPVDGDDWLARVNRSPRGVLSPSYAPRDLVDLRTLAPAAPATCVPPDRQCLRREAALALRSLGAALRAATGEGMYFDSAFRGHAIQCAVFGKWAWREGRGFCPTSAASALPGHSQHQLGTAIDVFTQGWARGGARFREGFGCTPGGRWLAAHAWESGFVLPYPLHPDHRAPGSDCLARSDARDLPDPRTGYKYEPWHLRYVGRDHAARFHAAWLASGPGSPSEITLEQWIRRERGVTDDVDAPVCDGCACDACATLRARAAATPDPCPRGDGVLVLDPNTGAPAAPAGDPVLGAVRATREGGVVVVRARVEVPPNTLTQPPIATEEGGLRAGEFPDLPGAVRLAIVAGESAAWRAALARPTRAALSNGVNARIPATTGAYELAVRLEGVAVGATLTVALVRDGAAVGERTTLRAP